MAAKLFAPWERDLKIGRLFQWIGVIATLWSLYVMFTTPRDQIPWGVPMLIISLLLLLYGIGRKRIGRSRLRGKVIESQAIAQLRSRLSPRIAMQTGVPLPYGGDADLVIDTRTRWVVEIKSHSTVAVQDGRLIRSKTGKDFEQTMRFLSQAQRAAIALRGTPVLWFPVARQNSAGAVKGIHVVTGPSDMLMMYCNLPVK